MPPAPSRLPTSKRSVPEQSSTALESIARYLLGHPEILRTQAGTHRDDYLIIMPVKRSVRNRALRGGADASQARSGATADQAQPELDVIIPWNTPGLVH